MKRGYSKSQKTDPQVRKRGGKRTKSKNVTLCPWDSITEYFCPWDGADE